MSNGATKRKTSSGFHFLAGLGSGVASAFLLQPADLLKTRVQQNGSPSLRLALRSVLSGPNPIRSLWRGTVPSVLRTGCGSALYFGMLNQMRQYAARLPSPTSNLPRLATGTAGSALPKLSHTANLTTGALARVAAGFLMNPLTVLKVRYESTHYAYRSLFAAATDIARREGLRGFFAGFGATAVRDAPYAGLYVVVYERAKVVLGSGAGERKGTGDWTWGVNFASGVLAAVTATTITNPFDAIKTRVQIAPGRYPNLWRAAAAMVREEGMGSMFRGLSLRIGRKALSSALTWTVYEELIRRAERRLVVDV